MCIAVGLLVLMHRLRRLKTSSSCLYLLDYLAIAAHTMACEIFDQLDASLDLRMSRPLARASPSLQARDSAISASVILFNRTAEAPKNIRPAPGATTAAATMLEFFEVAASTLIFT